MPGGDRTGPNGQGSKTGRGLGYCNGVEPRIFGRQLGRGNFKGSYGRGRGNGYGRRCFNPYFGNGIGINPRLTNIPNPVDPKVLLSDLAREKELIEKEIERIKSKAENEN